MHDAIDKMRRIARSKARKMACRDDAVALAEDMEIAGWIGFLESKREGALRWYDAVKAMRDCWAGWHFGIRARSRNQMKAGEREIPEQGMDLDAMEKPQPTVEETVYGCELMRALDRELSRDKRSRAPDTLSALILNGGELANGQARGLKLATATNRMLHKRKIKTILTRMEIGRAA